MWQHCGEAHLFGSKRTVKYKLLGSRAARESFERGAAAGTAVTDLSSTSSTSSERSRRCAQFELKRITDWLSNRRMTSPFVTKDILTARKGSIAKSSLLKGKVKGKLTTESSTVQEYAREFALMSDSPSAATASKHQPLQYKTCALLVAGMICDVALHEVRR